MVQPINIDSEKHEILKELELLEKEYAESLPENLQQIATDWANIKHNIEVNELGPLQGKLHKLVGSSGSFGFAELSKATKNLEITLGIWEQNQDTPSPGAIEQFSQSMALLPNTIEKNTPFSLNIHPQQDKVSPKPNRLVYILDDEPQNIVAIVPQLTNYGYGAQVFSTVQALRSAVADTKPDVLLVDVMLNEGDLAGPQLVQELRCNDILVDVAIIVYSARDDYQAKLEAVRAGADAYLQKPVEIFSLIYQMDRLTHNKTRVTRLKVLIVDDDTILSARYKLLLAAWEVDCHCLEHPNLILEEMASFSPDLVIMDLHLPDCSGLELAKLIRYHPQYTHMPIVFFSTEHGVNTQIQALQMGGDDFLTKPIDDHYFCQCILARLTRSRDIRELMLRDSLTGLLKHAVIKERLQSEMTRAKRNKSTFSYVMIDLDYFKRVNDTYGHQAGDLVLQSSALFLKTRLRDSDVIGRYGGEELAVILIDCSSQEALIIMNTLKDDFSKIQHVYEGKAFSITFSAGIAEFSDQWSDKEELCQAADSALYDAKNGGRNQVRVYNEHYDSRFPSSKATI